MAILIEGEGDVVVSVLNILIKNFEISPRSFIVSTFKNSTNINLINYCKNNGLRVSFSGYTEDFINELKGLNLTGVYSIYGRRYIPILRLNIDNRMTFNIHPSLLPEYGGCFSVPWVIINGEKETGITIHRISEEFDAGEILFQESVGISDSDTALTLNAKLKSLFISKFSFFYNSFINDDLNAVQREVKKRRSYYKRELPYGGVINERWDDLAIRNFIRAMIFPPFEGAILVKPSGKKIIVNSYAEFLKATEII